MVKLIVTRALLGIVTLFAVAVLIFVLTQILPSLSWGFSGHTRIWPGGE